MNYDEYNTLLKIYERKYKSKIELLKDYYEKNNRKISNKLFFKLCQKHRKLTIKLIKSLSKKVLKHYNDEVIVLINGSLARHSNNLFSDIDLNLLIGHDNDQRIIELEDIIDIILCNIMGFRGRDKVHTMAVYLPLKSNHNSIKDKLILEHQKIIIHYRENSEVLMYENYNSTRNIDEIIEYLNSHDTVNILNEWSNCFEIVYNKGNLKNKYKRNRKKCNSTVNLQSLIDNLILRIEKEKKLIFNEKIIKNRDLKKNYKTDVLCSTYEMLAIVFRYDIHIKKFNLNEFAKKSKLINKNQIDKIYVHLRNIQDLQLILSKMGLDLSSHSDEQIDLDLVNEYYEKLTNNTDIIEELQKSKISLYEVNKNVLEKVRRKLNEE